MPDRLLFLPALLLAILILSSCSVYKFAKIYASSDTSSGALYGEIYKKEATSYQIGKLGSDWKRVNIDYGDLFFSNKKKTSAITVNSTCDPKKNKYTLNALAGSLLVGIKGKKLVEREIVEVDNQEALFSLYDAEFEGDKLKIATVVFKKGKCVYDFSYSNINEEFNIYLKDFVNFISEFKVLE
jgi:hypothetical protein